jgi:DNA invertase Pin-like site-specific DNA recombinase
MPFFSARRIKHMTQQDHINDTMPQSGRALIYRRVAPREQTQPSQALQSQMAALIAFAEEQGFSNERITVYEEGSAPAQWLLAKRSALSDLLATVTQENQTPEQEPIKAIYVSSEQRLLKDASPADLASLISVCADRGIQLVTPTATYDFTSPDQAALFRLHCEQAVSYLEAQIGKLKQRGRARGGSIHKPVEEYQSDGLCIWHSTW